MLTTHVATTIAHSFLSYNLLYWCLLLQSMSGIEIEDDVAPLFNDIKLRATHKWVTFKIEKKKKIIIDVKGEPNPTEDKDADKASFEELKGQLTEEPRYILYDFGFTNKEGRKINKLAFIFWLVFACT